MGKRHDEEPVDLLGALLESLRARIADCDRIERRDEDAAPAPGLYHPAGRGEGEQT